MIYNLLFENLWLLSLLVLVAVLLAMIVHRRHGTVGTGRGLWMTALVGAALVLANVLVVTDGEQIRASVQKMAQAVDEGDIPALADEIDEQFHDGGLDQAQFVDRVNQELQRLRIDEPRLSAWRIEIGPRTATVSFRCFCDLRHEEQFQPSVLTRWKLEFVRNGPAWKLIRISDAKYGFGEGIDLHYLGW